MNDSTFELVPDLASWIGAGRHPSELVGARWKFLVESLSESQMVHPDALVRRAGNELLEAQLLAAGHEVDMPSCDSREASSALARWTHDVLIDPASATSLLGILDPLEEAMVRADMAQARRPTTLRQGTNWNPSRCDSCGAPLEVGAQVLTFDVTAGAVLPAELPTWAWCWPCVVDVVGDGGEARPVRNP